MSLTNGCERLLCVYIKKYSLGRELPNLLQPLLHCKIIDTVQYVQLFISTICYVVCHISFIFDHSPKDMSVPTHDASAPLRQNGFL